MAKNRLTLTEHVINEINKRINNMRREISAFDDIEKAGFDLDLPESIEENLCYAKLLIKHLEIERRKFLSQIGVKFK